MKTTKVGWSPNEAIRSSHASQASSSTLPTIEFRQELPFVETREHARFSEFAIACTTDRYIGVCHGRPGVGKTRSAREFSACPNLFDYIPGQPISPVLSRAVEGCRGLFFTAPVSNTPKIVNDRLQSNLFRLGHARLTLVGPMTSRWLRWKPEDLSWRGPIPERSTGNGTTASLRSATMPKAIRSAISSP